MNDPQAIIKRLRGMAKELVNIEVNHMKDEAPIVKMLINQSQNAACETANWLEKKYQPNKEKDNAEHT